MDLFEFQCPLCNAEFSADVTLVEFTCPHCNKITCLGGFDVGSPTNVSLVAKQITTPSPLFPPGYKAPTTNDTSESPATAGEKIPLIINTGVDVAKPIDATESVIPSDPVSEQLPVVIIDEDEQSSVEDTELVALSATAGEQLPSVITIGADEAKPSDATESVIPSNSVSDQMPVVIIDENEQRFVEDPPVLSPAKVPSVIMGVDQTELPISNETDTAIDDLLPPAFHLDDEQVKPQNDQDESSETPMIIDVRVDADPTTVGRGINKRELRSRTPVEKKQFTRNKNIIVWVFGVLIIIVTMILMLHFA